MMHRLIRIGELADALHVRSNRHRAFVMLKAFFDESGIHDSSAVTGLAGYVGSEASWVGMESEWSEIFSDPNIKSRLPDEKTPTFHLADLLAQGGDFSMFDRPTVNYVITRCAKILGRHNLVPFYSAVVQDDWDDEVTDYRFLARFPKPLDLCFDDLVRQMAEWSHKKVGGELIVPVFAHQSEYEDRFLSVYRSYGAEPWYASVLGTLGFDHPWRVIPLQGADLLSHQMRAEVERRRYGPLSGPTYALDWATGVFPQGHWFDASALRLTVTRWKETGEIYAVG